MPPAARPAHPATRPALLASLLHGMRLAAGLGFVVLAIQTVRLTTSTPWEGVGRRLPVAVGVLVGLVAWLYGRRRVTGRPPRLAITLAFCGPVAAAGVQAVDWWSVATRQGGFSYTPFLTGAAACVALGLVLSLDLTLRSHRDRRALPPERPDAAPGSDGGATSAPRSPAPDSRAHGTPDPAPRALRRPRAASAVGLLGVIALLTAGVLAPPAALLRPEQVTVAATAAPATPSTMNGDVAWSLELESRVLDVVAGAAGPVIAVGGGSEGDTVQGLDPTDGSVTWSYRRPYGSLEALGFGSDNPYPYLVPSPDGAYVVLTYDTPTAGLDLAVILSTATGEVTGERYVGSWSTIQVTDEVALIGRHAVSLSDGSVRWSLDPEGDLPGAKFVAPVGSSTLVLGATCGIEIASYYGDVCTLTLADDADPTVTRTLTAVTPTVNSAIVIVDGWTTRLAEGGQTDGQVVGDGTGEGSYTGTEMEAVNLDSVMQAASGITEEGVLPSDVETVPLGTFLVPTTTSRSTIPLQEASETADGAPARPSRSQTPSALFDPSTRSVVTIDTGPDGYEAPIAWPTADAGLREIPVTSVAGATGHTYLELKRPDGSASATIEVDPRVMSGEPTIEPAGAQATPGVVVVWALVRDGASQGSTEAVHSVVYGVT